MTLVYWHWLALGFGLLVLEMFLPTEFVLLWIGVAAIVVGAVAWVFPALGWPFEFVLWGLLALGAVLAWRHFKPLSFVSDQPTLNRRGHSYVGRQFTLSEPIVDGVGTLHVDDSQWRIAGAEDVPAGTHVRVVAAEGTILRVERI